MGLDWSPVTPRHFAWQAWHLVTSSFVSHGRRGTWRHPPFVSRGRRGTWRHPPSYCVAGVALGALGWLWWRAWSPDWLPVTPRHFAWQAWHLVTSSFVSRGRRGTWRHPPFVSRGRRGTWRHPPSYCVAGVALGALGWLWWRAWSPDWLPVTPRHFAWQAWHLVTSSFVSRGRPGTWRHLPSFCVAAVALTALGSIWWRVWARFIRR